MGQGSVPSNPPPSPAYLYPCQTLHRCALHLQKKEAGSSYSFPCLSLHTQIWE